MIIVYVRKLRLCWITRLGQPFGSIWVDTTWEKVVNVRVGFIKEGLWIAQLPNC